MEESKCSKCGAEIPAGATECPKCAGHGGVTSNYFRPGKILCPKCGFVMTVKLDRCPQCGRKLGLGRLNSPNWIRITVLCLVMLVGLPFGFVGGCILVMSSPSDRKEYGTGILGAIGLGVLLFFVLLQVIVGLPRRRKEP